MRACDDAPVTPSDLRLHRVTLAARADGLAALRAFYGDVLGLAPAPPATPGELAFAVGPDVLAFRGQDGPSAPFYHVALLASAARFDLAKAWLATRVTLLGHPGDPAATTFPFPFWSAQACYWHDPAGTILELIGHPEADDPGAPDGPFTAAGLCGLSEVGLVAAEPLAVAAELEGELGLPLWSGDLDRGGALGFTGRKGHTLILCPPGRPWLPTGRPAEPHPVHVEVTGASGAVEVAPGQRVTGVASA